MFHDPMTDELLFSAVNFDAGKLLGLPELEGVDLLNVKITKPNPEEDLKTLQEKERRCRVEQLCAMNLDLTDGGEMMQNDTDITSLLEKPKHAKHIFA